MVARKLPSEEPIEREIRLMIRGLRLGINKAFNFLFTKPKGKLELSAKKWTWATILAFLIFFGVIFWRIL